MGLRDASAAVRAAVAILLSGAVLSLSVLGPTGAVAQDKPEPPSWPRLVIEGRDLAERLCSGCHLIDERAGAATAGVPTFRSIANRRDQTAERIHNALVAPHPPMPDVQLSRPEIDRLLAYIDSLREPSSGPPLTPRSSPPPKPRYPDPT